MARGDGIDLANSPRLDVLLRNESDMAYRRRVRRMVAYLELAPGLTLLDCGTGMGFYLKVVTDLCPGCRLYGIDMDDKVLAYAWGHLRERGTVLARGDIHHLPFGDASMDRVLMSEVLEHLEDDAAALQEVYRVPAGGILAVTVPHARYPRGTILSAASTRPVLLIRTGLFAIWANHRRLQMRHSSRRWSRPVLHRAGGGTHPLPSPAPRRSSTPWQGPHRARPVARLWGGRRTASTARRTPPPAQPFNWFWPS